MTDEMKLRFLIVDDEQSIRRLCMTVGQGLGYICSEAETAESALEAMEMSPPDLVVTDLKLPSLSGTDLLRKTKEILPNCIPAARRSKAARISAAANVASMTGFTRPRLNTSSN